MCFGLVRFVIWPQGFPNIFPLGITSHCSLIPNGGYSTTKPIFALQKLGFFVFFSLVKASFFHKPILD